MPNTHTSIDKYTDYRPKRTAYSTYLQCSVCSRRVEMLFNVNFRLLRPKLCYKEEKDRGNFLPPKKFPITLQSNWSVSTREIQSMEKTNDKAELRERIIRTSMMLFKQHGIKQVRMDDVASELGISKKTLYSAFADKEAILLEVVKQTSTSLCEGIKETLSHSTNVVEQIYLLYKRVIEHSKEVNPLFFIELMRYAEMEAYFDRMHAEHFGYVRQWLQEGVKQGLLRDDIDYDVFLQQDGFQIDKLLRNPAVRKYPAEVIYNSVVLVLLRGLATEKGLVIIENLK